MILSIFLDFIFKILTGKDLTSIATQKHGLDSTYYGNSKILSAFKWEQDSFMMTVKQEQICPMIKQVNLFLSQDPDSIGLDCQYCVSSTPQQSNSSKKCTCFLSE